MISNYHTASGPAGGSAYYTFDDDAPPTGSKNKTFGGNGSAANAKKGGRRGMRGFKGWGRKVSSGDTITSDSSNGGQSLAYSTGSSVQSAGETTDSSQFSDILRELDENDRKEAAAKVQGAQQQQQQQYSMKSSGQSVTSSLNYSDTDGESHMGRPNLDRGASNNSNFSTDYSTDQESQLEGTKLLSMLMDEPKNTPPSLLDNFSNNPKSNQLDYSSEEEEPYDMKFEAARYPRRRSKPKPVAAPAVAPAPAMPTSSNTMERKSSQGGASQNSKDKSTTSRRSIASKRSKDSSTTKGSPSASSRKARPLHSKQQPQQPKTTESTSSIPPTTAKKAEVDNSSWTCGMQMLEDAIPPKVKAFLRPFLCGVL